MCARSHVRIIQETWAPPFYIMGNQVHRLAVCTSIMRPFVLIPFLGPTLLSAQSITSVNDARQGGLLMRVYLARCLFNREQTPQLMGGALDQVLVEYE